MLILSFKLDISFSMAGIALLISTPISSSLTFSCNEFHLAFSSTKKALLVIYQSLFSESDYSSLSSVVYRPENKSEKSTLGINFLFSHINILT